MSRATASNRPLISSRAEARARILELDAQISDLELSLIALRHQRTAVQEDWLDSYSYPVLGLPNEIVAEIFTQFLPPYPKRPPMTGLFSPSTLGQVCRKWRAIVISTPSLWRAIALDLDDTTQPYAAQLRLVETWLERSRACPLSISIEHDTEDTATLPIITTLLTHADRWEQLELNIPFSHMDLFSIARMSLLHTITVRPPEECPHSAQPVILFQQAPNLASVTLLPYFDPFLLLLPSPQITTLIAQCILEDELIEFLRLAVNVVHCTATLLRSQPLVAPIIPPHMYLQDLTLTDGSPIGPEGMLIFDHLTLPALRSLTIPEPWFSPNPAAGIASWLLRSGCKLAELRITDSELSESYYREALPSVPRISVVGE